MWRHMKRCHGRLHYDKKFQIFIFLIGHINVNKDVLCLIISYLQIKSYNVLNYNNCSTDWPFPLIDLRNGKFVVFILQLQFLWAKYFWNFYRMLWTTRHTSNLILALMSYMVLELCLSPLFFTLCFLKLTIHIKIRVISKDF